MCLIALLTGVVDDAPLLVGANREEFYVRGGEPPQLLDGRAVAGVDPVGGGTWLGLNRHGVLVAVTNRRKANVPDQPRSRGLLARDLLAHADAPSAVAAAVGALTSDPYAGCNILCADAAGATIVHAGDRVDVRPLPPGAHVVTNAGDVDDEGDARVRAALAFLNGRVYRCYQQGLTALEELCGSCERPAICLRGADRGTVSGALVAVRRPLAASVYLHAQGPPDRTPYRDYTDLWRGLL